MLYSAVMTEKVLVSLKRLPGVEIETTATFADPLPDMKWWWCEIPWKSGGGEEIICTTKEFLDHASRTGISIIRGPFATETEASYACDLAWEDPDDD